MNKRIQKKYKVEEQKTTVLIPDFVGDWISEIKSVESPNPDKLADIFAMLTIAELIKGLKTGKKWYQRLIGKIILDFTMDDLPTPKHEVIDWYGANVGNEGQLIAEAFLNGYETY